MPPRARRSLFRGLAGPLSLLWLGWLGQTARAQPLPADGEAFNSSNYAVDLTQGTVLSTSRVTGLAGAFTALGEGMEGGLSNPAAVAARTAASADWWDYFVALSVTYPFDSGDFYNSGDYLSDSGKSSSDQFLFLNVGGYLQLFGLGFGLNVEILQVTVSPEDPEAAKLRLQLVTNHVQVGYLFWKGQLALAGGLQILRERSLTDLPNADPHTFSANVGFGGELGVLIRPNWRQWRLGAGFYSLVRTAYDGAGSTTIDGRDFLLPEYAVRPWRGNVGFAYQLGKRPLNPRFGYVEQQAEEELRALERQEREARDEHAQRSAALRAEQTGDQLARVAAEEREFSEQMLVLEAERDAVRKRAWRALRIGVRSLWQRRYVLLTGELGFAGKVDNGVGVQSFLAQTMQRSGERVTVTPRVAAEAEVWPNHVKVRAGSYYEPTRFRSSEGRLHGTFGIDIRVLRWDVFRIWPEDYWWQIAISFDLTRDYRAFSAGIGGWY